MLSRDHLRLVGAIVGCGIGTSIVAAQPAAAPPPHESDTASEIRELRSEVRELRARLDAQSSSQAKAGATEPASPASGLGAAAAGPAPSAYEQVDRDLSKPDDLLGLHAGYDRGKGFIIRSEDGSFLLHPWAFIQVRDATTYRSRATPSGGADTQNGFEAPRAKFILDGNVFSKDLTYQFIWATSDTTGNLSLQDAWARYHFPSSPWAVEAGQIRDPVDHEQILFATKSMTPERSIVNNVLLNGDDIVKGVSLSYGYDSDADWRSQFAFTSGQRNSNTTFEGYPTNDANWGAAGRVEWKLTGQWKDYTQFTALGDSTPLLVFGGGVDYTEAGGAAAFTHVADVQYDLPEGTSFYAAYLGRYTRGDAGSPATNGQFTSTSAGQADTYDSTVRVMAAQLFNQRFEPFVRYEYIQFDPREFPAGFNSAVHDITLGANYYLYGHRAKMTAAGSYLPNGSPIANTIGDLLTSHRGDEFIFQLQFQLMI